MDRAEDTVGETGLTRFERELIRHLRALPFEAQQHVARYVLKLRREHGTIPQDPHAKLGVGDAPLPQWDLAPDELRELRRATEDGKQDDVP